MFRLSDSNGNKFVVEAEHWVAGISGVTFSDSRGKTVAVYDWTEIGDASIERVNG